MGSNGFPRAHHRISRTSAGSAHPPEVDTTFLMGVLARLSEGDLAARGEMQDLKNSINAMVAQLNGFVAESTRVAREMPPEDALGQAGAATEAGAQTERARFRSLVQNSRHVIAVIDEEGLCSYVSPGVVEVTGFSPEDVVGSPGLDFVHPDDLEMVLSHLTKLQAVPGATETVEVRTRTKEGSWIWVEIRAANHLDDPSIRGLVLNYHDIGERHVVIERLAQSEKLLAEGQALSHIGSFSWDLRTDKVAWSDEQYRLLGYEVGSVVPSFERFLERVHPDDAEAVLAGSIASRETGAPYEAEFRLAPREGVVRWISERAEVSLEDGVPACMTGMSQDITTRREARDQRQYLERKLRESERLFKGAFDASQTGIALLAADGLTYRDVNGSLCRMLGYPKAELLELDWRQITHPDDLPRDFEEFAELLGGRSQVDFKGKRYIRKDGTILWAEVIDSIVPGPDGSPAYFVTHVTDVTERETNRLDNERLEGQLAQAQKMEAVGQLAGGIAHDFNNILSVILNYARFVSEGMDADDPRLADVGEISKAGKKAATLVHQLLAFSRKEIVEQRVIDLNEVVTGVHSILSRSLGEDIDLDFEPAIDLPTVCADPGRIEQVLLNIAVNARDAMPTGGMLKISTGVDLIADDRPPLTQGEYVFVTLSDTGIGMDESTMTRIFDPFFTTKPRGEGTGMGLSSSYGILEQAGGSLSVASKLGEGTTFTLRLPVCEDGASGPDDVTPEPATGGSEQILLVEDEDVVRHLVSRILEGNGFHVVQFSNGPEALEYLRENLERIDLLLTDVVMPSMSGKELADQASLICTGLKTLFMSGYTDELIQQRGGLSANENLIVKPFGPEELLHAVRSLLDTPVPV